MDELEYFFSKSVVYSHLKYSHITNNLAKNYKKYKNSNKINFLIKHLNMMDYIIWSYQH